LTPRNSVVKINDIMARRQTSQLTSVHARCLEAIAYFVGKKGYATPRELVNRLGLAGVTSITRTLQIMKRNGFVEIHGGGTQGERRTISLTPQAKALVGIGGVPLLGSIPAGPLTETISGCNTVIDVSELLPHKPGDFLLAVDGDSMIGDGILPGDLVLLRPNILVNEGQIAAVHVGEEHLATLKHVHFAARNRKVTLRASNPAYEDMVVPVSSVKVAGVYKGLVRIG
jgi:repressor LexA